MIELQQKDIQISELPQAGDPIGLVGDQIETEDEIAQLRGYHNTTSQPNRRDANKKQHTHVGRPKTERTWARRTWRPAGRQRAWRR